MEAGRAASAGWGLGRFLGGGVFGCWRRSHQHVRSVWDRVSGRGMSTCSKATWQEIAYFGEEMKATVAEGYGGWRLGEAVPCGLS